MTNQDIKVSVGLDKASLAKVSNDLKMAAIRGVDLSPADFEKIASAIKGAISSAGKSGSPLGKEIASSLSRNLSLLKESFNAGTSGSVVFNRQLVRTMNLLKELSSSSASKNPTARIERALINGSSSIKRTERELTVAVRRETESRMSARAREARDAEKILEKMNRDQKRKFNESFVARVKHAARTVAAYSAVGIPLMYTRQLFRGGMEREQSIQDAFAMGSGSGKDLFGDLGRFSRETTLIANSSGLAANEVDRLALSMAQAGITGAGSEKVLRGMSDAMRMSFGQLDARLAIKGFNALKNTFFQGEAAAPQYEKTMASLNRMIALSNVAASDPRQIIEAVTKVGAGAGLAGFSVDDLGALLIGATEQSGVDTQIFATMLRRVLPRLGGTRIRSQLESDFDIKYFDDINSRYKTQAELISDLGDKYRSLLAADRTDQAARLATIVAGSVRQNELIKFFEAQLGLQERKNLAIQEEQRAREKIESMNDTFYKDMEKAWNMATLIGTQWAKNSIVISATRDTLKSLADSLSILNPQEASLLGNSVTALTLAGLAKASTLTAGALTTKGLLAKGGLAAAGVATIPVVLKVTAIVGLAAALSEYSGFSDWVAEKTGRGAPKETDRTAGLSAIEKVTKGLMSTSRYDMSRMTVIDGESIAERDLGHEISKPLSYLFSGRDFRGLARRITGTQDKPSFETLWESLAGVGGKQTTDLNRALELMPNHIKELEKWYNKQWESFAEKLPSISEEDSLTSSNLNKLGENLKQLGSRASNYIRELEAMTREDALADIDAGVVEGFRSQLTDINNELSRRMQSEGVSPQELSAINELFSEGSSISKKQIRNLEAMVSRITKASSVAEKKEDAEQSRQETLMERLREKTLRANAKMMEQFLSGRMNDVENAIESFGELFKRQDSESSRNIDYLQKETGVITSLVKDVQDQMFDSLVDSTVGSLIREIPFLSNFVSDMLVPNAPFGSSAMKIRSSLGGFNAGILSAGSAAPGFGALASPLLSNQIGISKMESYEKRMITEGHSKEKEAIEFAKKSSEHLESIDKKTSHVEDSMSNLISFAMLGKADPRSFFSELFAPKISGLAKSGAMKLGNISLGGLRMEDILTMITGSASDIQDIVGRNDIVSSGHIPNQGDLAKIAMVTSGFGGGVGSGSIISSAIQASMGGKAANGAASKVLSGQALKGFKAISSAVTVFGYAMAAKEILKSGGIGTTRVFRDDSEEVEETNKRVEQMREAMNKNAVNFVQSDLLRMISFEESYDTVQHNSRRRGGLQGLFGGRNDEFVSDLAGFESLEEMKRMTYEATINAANYESDMRHRELDMMRDRLSNIKVLAENAEKYNIELDQLGSHEAEAISIKDKLMDSVISSAMAAVGTSAEMGKMSEISRKYLGDRGLFGLATDYTLSSLEQMIRPTANALISEFNKSWSQGDMFSYANSLGIRITPTGDMNPARLDNMGSMVDSENISSLAQRIEALARWAAPFGSDSSQWKLVEIATDILMLNKAQLQEQMNLTARSIESTSYLAMMESSLPNINEMESSSGKSFQKFASDILSGRTTSIGGEDWTYRVREMSQKFDAIQQFANGDIGSNIAALWNPSILETMLSGSKKTPEEIEYAKSLISSLTAGLSGAFGESIKDRTSSGVDEESNMYQVGSSGKYYITQNFTVESTYFGGSQTDAVNFLKFLSKAWNSVGGKNSTAKLF